MKVLICTPLYPPDIGGPAKYAQNISRELKGRGHEVKVLGYGLEKKLPTGTRHYFYLLKVAFNIWGVDLIIALDTFSVGFPAVCAAKIFKKKIVLRVGGDFLWESYIEKTGNLIVLKNFYKNLPKLSFKQRIIFSFTKFTLKNAKVAFTTEWQKEIFIKTYELEPDKTFVIENFCGLKEKENEPKEKNFLWAGRDLKLKNLNMLKQAFGLAQKENKEIKLEVSEHVLPDELMEKIKNCYAVILPSVSEVSPNFILEAIRFNKLFILTEETGLHGKLKDIGLFINPLDKEDIKNKILFLADDTNYSEYKKRVKNFDFTHTWSQIADEFLSIYKIQ